MCNASRHAFLLVAKNGRVHYTTIYIIIHYIISSRTAVDEKKKKWYGNNYKYFRFKRTSTNSSQFNRSVIYLELFTK